MRDFDPPPSSRPFPAGHQLVLSGAEGHISHINGAGHFDGLADVVELTRQTLGEHRWKLEIELNLPTKNISEME